MLYYDQINSGLVLESWGSTTTPGGIYTPSGDETATYTSATAMPNQINAVGTRSNTSQPLEFQNPTTLAWVTGTMTSTAGGNEFAATLAGVAPAVYPAGSLKMRVVGFPTVYYNSFEVTVTASGSTPQPLVFTPQSSEFYPNKRNDTTNTDAGFVWRDGMAAWAKRYTGNTCSFEAKSSFDGQYISTTGITVFVNNAWFGFYPLSQAGMNQAFTVSGLPDGKNLLEFAEGYSYRGNEVGTVRVTNLTKVTFPDGSKVESVTRSAATEALSDVGNSRAGAGGLADGPRYGFLRRYGRLRSAAVYLTGYSSLQMGAHVMGATAQQLLVDEAVARLSGATTQRYIIGPDSENDWASGKYSPAQLDTAYRQLIPKLQSALPNILTYVATTFSQKSGFGGANTLGFTQQDYYNMEKGIAASFNNCRTLDFMAAGLTPADFADESHLGSTGEDKLLSYTISVFDNTAPTPPPVKTYTQVYQTGFDESTSLPAAITATGNFFVTANGTAPSAPNTLRLNTPVESQAEIANVKVTTGRATVDMNLQCASGESYANLFLVRQANGNCYRVAVNTSSSANKTNLYLQHIEPGSSTNSQSNITSAVGLDKWVGYYTISVALTAQGLLTVRIKRLSDNFYLNGSNNQFGAQEANWTANLQDNFPLALLPGTGGVYCNFTESNAGNVVDFDNLKLENYA